MVEIIGIDPPEHLTPIAVNESKNDMQMVSDYETFESRVEE